MEINNSGINDISLDKPNAVAKSQQNQTDNVDEVLSTQLPSVELSLSNAGKLTQQLDQTSMEIDQILSSHLSPEQKKALNTIYQKLDNAFGSYDDSANSETKIENLFEQAHQILETSVDKLSATEKHQVDVMVNKMDYLEHQLAQVEQDQSAGSIPISGRQEQGHEIGVTGVGAPAKKKKSLSVAELNALSAAELNKLPPDMLKKLNAQQLNKLNISQLNLLPENLLSKLTSSNLAKITNPDL